MFDVLRNNILNFGKYIRYVITFFERPLIVSKRMRKTWRSYYEFINNL